MDGTASTYTDDFTPVRHASLLKRLKHWASGQSHTIFEECKLVDITECGGAVLIPNNLMMSNSVFSIIIQPNKHNKTSCISQAELRWANVDYSAEYVKIGFQLKNLSINNKRLVKQLIKTSAIQEDSALECSLKF